MIIGGRIGRHHRYPIDVSDAAVGVTERRSPPVRLVFIEHTRSAAHRIGVYPGSFNPPTVAHLAIAGAAYRDHELTRIDLTVSRNALAKEDVDHPRFEHRIAVLQRIAAELTWLQVRVTDHQLLADVSQGYDVLVVGADKWWQIQDPAWYGGDVNARDDALARLPTVAVAPRAGHELPVERRLDVGGADLATVSSTAARSGRVELMAPAARRFAEETGAWVDESRYRRWLSGTEDGGRPR